MEPDVGAHGVRAVRLHRLLDVPDEGARSLHARRLVHRAEGFEQRRDLLVTDDGQDRGVYRRPRMRAVVGFAVDRSAPLGQRLTRKAADALLVEDGVHTVGKRLIIG